MRRHLYFTMKETDELGILCPWPDLSPDAGIDAVRAAVAEVNAYVEKVKRDRELAVHRERALAAVPHVPPPRSAWRARWTMLKDRLGRRDRCGGRGSV